MIKRLIVVLCFLSLILQIFFRYKLTLTRYFDVDEYAHLHWGYNILTGSIPYRDFFYIFPPYFLFPVAAIIAAFGRKAQTLIAVRGFIFLIQLAAYIALFLWARKLRGMLVALMALVIFIFLPLPSDKLLEIRPDLLATVLSIAGLLLFVKAYENKKAIIYFISGFLFSISLAIVPKTVFFLVPVTMVMFFRLNKSHLFFVLGVLLNFILVAFFFAASGKFLLALYLTTKLASDVTKVLASKFYMRPDIFFYPNDTFYGTPGISQTLIVNLIIYFVGIVWGIKNFVSSLSYTDDKKCVREFVFSATLMINLYAFVKIFPLKHLQYLIPVSPFVAFYFADLIVGIASIAKQSRPRLPRPLRGLAMTLIGLSSEIILVLIIGYLTYLSFIMFRYKSPWTNSAMIGKLNKLLTAIPQGEPVFDLTGETIFYPDGYYFCCLPYGQYQEALNFKFPDFKEDIERRGTKYVHIGRTDRLEVLPAVHARYIRENFKESEIAGILVKSEKKQ